MRKVLKKITLSTTVVICCLVPSSIFAENLMEVFHYACINDPTIKAARSEFLANEQNVPISVAAFLPQIFANGTLGRERVDNQTAANPFDSDTVFYNNSAQYSLSATQSIFNFANWARLSEANAFVKQSAANLSSAVQDLMIRTVTAYFNVLVASEDLRFIRAEKKATERQLKQNQERFKVGLIAITSVYESQAQFDSVTAQEIAQQNQLENRIEELREITNKAFPVMKGVGDHLPLVKPKPANIDRWVAIAEKQNYELQAAHYATLVSKAVIKEQFAGHLPVVSTAGNYKYSFQDNPYGIPNGDSRVKVADISIAADLPIFSGGATTALTRQARFNYLAASANEVKAHRSVVSNTRQSYLGVISGISQVKADKQTIISRRSAFEATEAAYNVGTRTFVDVLDAQSRLYDSERVHTNNQYRYLLNTLLLKQAAGTLCIQDLYHINRMLEKNIAVKSMIHS